MKPGETMSTITQSYVRNASTEHAVCATTDRETLNTKEQSLSGTLEIMNIVEPITWIGMD